MNDPRLEPLIARIIANARMPRDLDVLLDPDWVVIPRDLVEQLEDIVSTQEATP